MSIQINGHKFKICIESSEIQREVKELGTRISQDYSDQDLVIIGVLKGGFIFLADLVRNLNIDAEIDFVRVSSYKEKMQPGDIEFVSTIRTPLLDKHVLLVEDLLDTGNTLDFIKRNIMSQKPASLKVCALIKKKKNRQKEIDVDYVGFEIEDKFIVGYGTDFAEKGRYLPDIYVVE